MNKTQGGDCRDRDENDPARSVEAVSDSAAKNARETRQVGERMAGPAEHYVHSNPMDGRLHARPAALQVSARCRMRNLAALVMEREADRTVGADSSLKLNPSRRHDAPARKGWKRDKREGGSDGHRDELEGAGRRDGDI